MKELWSGKSTPGQKITLICTAVFLCLGVILIASWIGGQLVPGSALDVFFERFAGQFFLVLTFVALAFIYNVVMSVLALPKVIKARRMQKRFADAETHRRTAKRL
ncbi:hypothetical protein [Chitiniphilus shinanonensis]|uniref:hypothetical protein n=1 Tax=Chitiniphilus shinanonensis TaxID=553088 RepID=UPI00305E7A3D